MTRSRKDSGTQEERGDLLTRSEVARELKVPVATLAQWAYQGTGPTFYRIGRHVRYSLVELDRWLETRRAGALR